jgi:hypothetical protein
MAVSTCCGEKYTWCFRCHSLAFALSLPPWDKSNDSMADSAARAPWYSAAASRCCFWSLRSRRARASPTLTPHIAVARACIQAQARCCGVVPVVRRVPCAGSVRDGARFALREVQLAVSTITAGTALTHSARRLLSLGGRGAKRRRLCFVPSGKRRGEKCRVPVHSRARLSG